MKLISLNTWGGKIFEPLIDFIKQHSQGTDIFCFQEVFKTNSNVKEYQDYRMNLFDELSKILISYKGYFYSALRNYTIFSPTDVVKTDFELHWGLVIFIKNQLQVDSKGDFMVYGKRYIFDPHNLSTLPRNAQHLTFTSSGKKITICNLHGVWLKDGKGDSTSRLEQSKKIIQFLEKQDGEKIICGDFNLNIDTQSIKLLENNFRNLIKEYHIPTTRNDFFPGPEKFADYMFVSKGIKVLNFQVPNIQISDHLPMILEFS